MDQRIPANLLILRAAIVAAFFLGEIGHAKADALPSWNDTGPKSAIVAFVQKVTDPRSPDFVPPAERIATFDNDGTLWAEQPLYFQAIFIFDRIEVLAPQNPEWTEKQPFASVLGGNRKAALAGGEKSLVEMAMATHAGTTTEEFAGIVTEWMAKAKHPTTGRQYTDMVYQPMLELLSYLRANGFKTFIVSGGGIEFMRPWVERVYGIPPEQVIGSSIKTKYEIRNGRPVLERLPDLNFVDDKDGKPVGINQHIGRRPIIAFGNSDGDFQMLEWTTAGPGPRLGLLLHHTDERREWAYDRESHVGKLARGLDEGPARGWTIVDMKHDWKVVFSARNANE
ncbi:MAG: haloacid dehalogenase-like hydrolase [Gammaproteobacteria bacterium]|nr:haloacid dehalogenase-like hydrolase [Gammaproteobacteria bacterium]